MIAARQVGIESKSMIWRCLIAIAVLLLGGPVGADSQRDLSGEWVGSFLGHRLAAHVRQQGERIDAVAYLHKPFGGVDTYHFTGSIRDGKVVASHHEGHMFRGELISPAEVRGVLVTRGGERLEIGAQKR
jgi:hypothetical protein